MRFSSVPLPRCTSCHSTSIHRPPFTVLLMLCDTAGSKTRTLFPLHPQIEAIVKGTASGATTSGFDQRRAAAPPPPPPPPGAALMGATPPISRVARSEQEQAGIVSRKRALETECEWQGGSWAGGSTARPNASGIGAMARNAESVSKCEAVDDDDDHCVTSPYDDDVAARTTARSPQAVRFVTVGFRHERRVAAGAQQNVDQRDAWTDCMRSLQQLASGEQPVLPRCAKRMACGHNCVRAVHVADGSITCACDRCGDASEVAASERRRWQPLREAIVVRGTSNAAGCATSPAANQSEMAARYGQVVPRSSDADAALGGAQELRSVLKSANGGTCTPLGHEPGGVGRTAEVGDLGNPFVDVHDTAAAGGDSAVALECSPGWSDDTGDAPAHGASGRQSDARRRSQAAASDDDLPEGWR